MTVPTSQLTTQLATQLTRQRMAQVTAPESTGLTGGEVALWALVLLPAMAGALMCVAVPRRRLAVAVSLVSAGVVVALATLVAIERPAVAVPFVADTSFALTVDALSAVVLVTVAIVALLVLLFASADVTDSRARFHGLMLLFLAAVVVTATATNLLTLLMAWEIMGATSYALIGFGWREAPRVESGAVAFLTTRAADLGLYLAAGAALAGGAGLDLARLSEAAPGWLDVIAAGVLVAALGKAAQLPFSFWLSRAMAGPSAVSALLHSAAMVAMGGYLLLRVSDLLQSTGWAGWVAAWAGALTALVLGLVAAAQSDLKQLLAASTSAQLGFVVLAAGVGAVGGGTAHFVAHAVTKALLFLLAGAWLTALATKELAALRGVGRRWPGLGAAAAVGGLALAGVAPLSLWATKDEVLASALERSPALYLVGLAAGVVSAAYAAKILAVIWSPRPDAAVRANRGSGRVAPVTWVPVAVLAVGSATLGALALPPGGDWLREVLGDRAAPTATLAELATSGVLAVVVAAATAGLLVRRRRRGSTSVGASMSLPPWSARSTGASVGGLVAGWLSRWLDVESAVRRGLVDPTRRLATRLAAFDDRVLDRGVDRTAAAAVAMAARLGRLDDRGVDGFVERFAGGVRRLGEYARRPQTGQLHEYYIQATALLAVGIVIVIVAG